MENFAPTTQLLNDDGKNNLLAAAKWAGILAWLVFGLLGLALIIFGVMTLFISGDTMGLTEGLVVTLTFIVGAGIYVVGAYFLFKFSRLSKQGLRVDDGHMVAEGVKYLQYFFLYIAILAIIGIVIYAIAFLGMGLFSNFI